MRFYPTIWLALGAIGIPLFSQAPQDSKPSFEVASIKPNISGESNSGGGPRGDGFYATNMTLRSLFNYAYGPPNVGLLNDQIIGGPDWIKTDRFDVQAKADADTRAMPNERLRLMLQSLLEERFQLKLHRESRDLPVYDLVVAKSGLKMHLSQDQSPPPIGQRSISFGVADPDAPPLLRGAIRIAPESSGTVLVGNAIRIASLVGLLQGQTDRIVRDKTGLDGLFDVHLQFTRESGVGAAEPTPLSGSEPASSALTPSLFTAIQELGLKLESAKAPYEVLVIDSVQKLKPND